VKAVIVVLLAVLGLLIVVTFINNTAARVSLKGFAAPGAY
jgi:hypothetical protein